MKMLIAMICLIGAAFAQTTAQTAQPPYVIGTGDIVNVRVWEEPELSNALPVRSDGMISMPVLNKVRAAGLTPMQLAASIAKKLKGHIDYPRVTVMVIPPTSHWLKGIYRGIPPNNLQSTYPKNPAPMELRHMPDLQDSPGGIIFQG